jgi:tetratricopeptide (TPR) repeat protein
LVAQFPDVPLYRQRLARTLNHQGVLNNTGRAGAAEAAYGEARVLLTRLTDDFPNEPTYRHDLAHNYLTLGHWLESARRAPEAVEQYEQAVLVLERLAADFPNVPEHRDSLARSLNNLGNLLRAARLFKKAEEIFQRALRSWTAPVACLSRRCRIIGPR